MGNSGRIREEGRWRRFGEQGRQKSSRLERYSLTQRRLVALKRAIVFQSLRILSGEVGLGPLSVR
jgi:hypothetical protein